MLTTLAIQRNEHEDFPKHTDMLCLVLLVVLSQSQASVDILFSVVVVGRLIAPQSTFHTTIAQRTTIEDDILRD
jgi:hypothetical protein